jgi:GST-like protein
MIDGVDHGIAERRGEGFVHRRSLSRFEGGTVGLARRVELEEVWADGDHSELCCLIYATQNGWKLPILFEELGQPYDWALVDFEKGEQRSERFATINPNRRIPALVDRRYGVTVAESGAILEYVARRFDSPLLPHVDDDRALHLAVKQWLYWQVSGLGPSMGQAMYFQRIARVRGHDDPFAIGRFVAEAERCLQMLDDQLARSGGPFVLGERITLVDVACFPYAASAFWAGCDIGAMGALQAWIERLHDRPSFARGLTIPFERPAFFGPPRATQDEIDAELARNAGQFEVVTKTPG